jgi:hypothetical protein
MLMRPKNWGDFQHYKDRLPPWIKLHRSLLTDREFMCLPIASKAIAPLLWLLASESKDGSFDGSLDELQFRLHISKKDYEDGIKPLIDKGFFVVDSEVLADCFQVATPERETETETKRETEKKATVVATPEGVSQSVWDDFVKHRKAKKAQVTQTVIDGIAREAQKAGWSLDDALRETIVRNWASFKADWVADKNLSQTGQMNQRVASGLTRGLIGGGSNVKLLGN